MFRKIYLIIFVLVFTSFVSAQERTREQRIQELKIISSEIIQAQAKLDQLESRRDNISEEILAVNAQDRFEAEKIGAKAVRLFPDGVLDNLLPTSDDLGFSVYSFEEINSDYYFAPRIRYKNNSLEFIKDDGNSFGFMANLGGTLIEMINEQNKEFIALAKYELPENFNNVGNDYSYEGVTFRSKVPVVAGNTYLVRAFNKGGNDGIIAFKIHRKDSDGSIILFVKKIKDFSAPELQPNTSVTRDEFVISDYATQQAVTNTLLEKGFYNVTVEATTTEVTIRGTVPKGKTAEVMQLVNEVAKRKVNNQVTEQR